MDPKKPATKPIVIPNATSVKFIVGSGKVISDSRDCKDRYGDKSFLTYIDNNGESGYYAQCFKFKNLQKSNINDTHFVMMMRVNRLRRDSWWNIVDKHLRNLLMVNLKSFLNTHNNYRHIANWGGGRAELLYLEDTPTNIDFTTILAVFVIFIDDVAIPNVVIKPVLDRTMKAVNRAGSSTFRIDYVLYSGIPTSYRNILVNSQNEFMASVLAGCTLGGTIFMVMLTAVCVGIHGAEEEEEDGEDQTEVDMDGDVTEGADNSVSKEDTTKTDEANDIFVNKMNITGSNEALDDKANSPIVLSLNDINIADKGEKECMKVCAYNINSNNLTTIDNKERDRASDGFVVENQSVVDNESLKESNDQ